MSNYEDAHYNDSNRAFLQAFLARSTMTFEEAKPILAAIFSVLEDKEVLAADITIEDLNSYINAANTAISPFDLEIRSVLHQITRERSYSLVNTTSDPLTQLATSYTADEIAFLKRLLDHMFETNNTQRSEIMAVTSFDALKLAKGDGRRDTQNGSTQSVRHGLTMVEAEKTLQNLVDEGWFEKSRKGFYSLTPRALMELGGWLVSTYNDPDDEEEEDRVEKIKMCQACKEIITVGQRCSQRQCPCRLHDICTQSFFRAKQSNRCPLCRIEWSGKDYVGEKVITTSDKYMQGRRRSGSNSRRNTTQVNGAEDEGGGEEEAD